MSARSHAAVIVGIDGSAESRRALEWAVVDARLRQRPLQVVHAVDSQHGQAIAGTSTNASGDLPGPRRIVDDAVAEVRRRWPDVPMTGTWRVGTPWAVLVRESADAELLVVGSRGHGRLASILLGSVSTEVAQFARCPVIVVRETRSADHTAGRGVVVVGVDGSVPSFRAVEFAFGEASRRDLTLTVVHAVWDPPVRSQTVTSDADRLDIAETIARWRETYPDVKVDIRYENGRPPQVLADCSDGADLLVVGSRGLGPAARLLGSVSRGVLRYARCPVAIVGRRARHRGDVSPIRETTQT